MKKITKAVIPAAGLGTRVLPATKAMPKGMLPLVDKPAIQYLVEEAVRSGITDILIIGEIDKTAHLDLKAIAVVLNGLRRHHLTHIRAAGRISDHTGAAADESDRLIARLLKPFHQTERHKMTYVKAVCRRVKTDIKYGLAVVYHFSDLFFICDLCDQSAGH